jgi:hypothetical protein
MKKEDLFKKARDPKYISGIYNYCDRWCERCQFTSRCLNCTIVDETAGDLKSIDRANEDFWKQLFEILGETLAMVQEMARETGVDIENICTDEDTRKETPTLPDILSHLSKKYVTKVDDWFDAKMTHLSADKNETVHLIKLLDNLKNRVESRFPDARSFKRPGFDDDRL